jgi:hypothetical protein
MEGSLVAYKVFTNGSVLNASEINDNLMNQSVMVFSNSAARTAAITSPLEGMLTWLEDVNRYESYNGSAWVPAFGLTHLVSQTIGSAVSSIAVNNVFSSAYDNYRVIINTSATANGAAITMQLNNSTSTTYSTLGFYMQLGSNTVVGSSDGSQARAVIGLTSPSTMSSVSDVINPFASTTTQFYSNSMASGFSSHRAAFDTSTASSTGFTITPGGGTLTGGTITVYGYRKA